MKESYRRNDWDYSEYPAPEKTVVWIPGEIEGGALEATSG